ncbi:MAG: Omp28-related outer membrane protein, partial [Bacteroidales bacterium]
MQRNLIFIQLQCVVRNSLRYSLQVAKNTKIATSFFNLCSFVALLLLCQGLWAQEGDKKLPLAPSTELQLKNVLIEEFTGIHCPNCPRGHKIAQSLMSDFHPYVYTIAFHTGGYARPEANDPDYRTPYGDSLAKRIDVGAYPSATINRKEFKNELLYSTSDWRKRVKICHADTAKVNLYLDVHIDTLTRLINVTVEGYYTQTDLSAFHVLNVALLQNNIVGPQAGDEAGNQKKYVHVYMMRDMLTGLYGDTIRSIQKGNTFTKTYTYTVPAAYHEVPANMHDLQVLAFLEQTDHQILNVIGSAHKLPEAIPAVKARIASEGISKRYASEYFKLYVKNEGLDTIQNLSFEFQINGNTQSAQWTGVIAPFTYQYIVVPTKAYTLKPLDNTCTILLNGINKKPFAGNSIEFQFNGALESTTKIYMEFKPDLWGEENQIILKTLQGEVVYVRGPFPNKRSEVYYDTLELKKDTLYSLEITDKAEDGLKAPSGYIKLYKSNHSLLYQNYDIQGVGDVIPLNASLVISAIETSDKLTQNSCLFFENGQYVFDADPHFSLPKNLVIYTITGQKIGIYPQLSNRFILPSLHPGVY